MGDVGKYIRKVISYMKDYLEVTGVTADRGTEPGSDRGIRLLFGELGKNPERITNEIRRGYTKALSQLPQPQRFVFRMRAGAGLTLRKTAAVCRSMNSMTGQKALPETISGVRQAYLRAEEKLLGPDLWKYIEKGYTKSAAEDRLTIQAAVTASEDRMLGLPKPLQYALRRNGIQSLDDERLRDASKRKKLSGIGPKKMSLICSYMSPRQG